MGFRRTICFLLVLIFMLCGCEANPEREIVTSKNDGTFDIGKVQTAEESSGIQESIEYNRFFYSTDGSVEYYLDICGELQNISAPVIEVTPYFFSTEDAKKISNILFGEADIYYSHQHFRNVVFSKDEILQKISRWAEYSNNNRVYELYGRQKPDTVRIIQEQIGEFTTLLETAPVESQKIPCTWEFKNELNFYSSTDELNKHDLKNANDAIKTELDVGTVHYAYNVVRRDKQDFKMSRISAYLYGGKSPDNIDERIYTALLCRTEAPTEEQVNYIKEKAEKMLEEMELGDWLVDQCKIKTTWYGNTPEYIVYLTAVPVFEDMNAVRRPQLQNLLSEKEYASNYYLTDVTFEFSATGDLISFELNSPVEVVEVINDNAQTLSFDILIEKAEQYLSLFDYGAYGLPMSQLKDSEELLGEGLLCKVSIDAFDYGLARVKAPNTNERYYYVPSLALYGVVEYYGENSGTVYSSTADFSTLSGKIPLIMLNAIDGSIIELGNN